MSDFSPDRLDIRLATLPDLPALLPIWLEMMQEHAEQDQRFKLAEDASQQWLHSTADMVRREDAFLLEATIDSEKIGFCLGWIAYHPPIYQSRRVGFISEVAVAKKLRRSGVGKALFEGARGWFAAQSIEDFQLTTAVWNRPAQAFWEGMGGEALLMRYRFATMEQE